MAVESEEPRRLPLHRHGEVVGWAYVDPGDLARLEAMGNWRLTSTGHPEAHDSVYPCWNGGDRGQIGHAVEIGGFEPEALAPLR